MNSTDYDALLSSLQHREALQQELLRFGRTLQSVESYGELLLAIQTCVRQVLGYKSSWVYLLSEDRQSWYALSAAGDVAAKVLSDFPTIPITNIAAYNELLSGNGPMVIEDAQYDDRIDKRIAVAMGARTLISVPMRLLSEHIGMLGVGTFKPEGIRLPRDEELDFLENMARSVAAVAGRLKISEDHRRMEWERRDLESRFFQAQKLESLGMMAGGVAHDLNNLFQVILGEAEMAEMVLSSDHPALDNLTRLTKVANQAVELAEQMLIYAGRGPHARHRFDLRETLEKMQRLMRATLPRGVALELQLGDAPQPIDADPVQIRQVLMNLLTNAAEAIGESKGTITLSLEGAPGEVVVVVSDTGCGMDAKTQERIFDPFFTTRPTGRGLGLASVHGIVRAHGGEIQVESELGSGATFRVAFMQR
ncbi:MAG: ATP-binding protein [Myxococcota bacterium]|nr:ATP-binding protein [Myxococcota bacterium]